MRIFLLALMALFVMALPVMAVEVDVTINGVTSFSAGDGSQTITVTDPGSSFTMGATVQTFTLYSNQAWSVNGTCTPDTGNTLTLVLNPNSDGSGTDKAFGTGMWSGAAAAGDQIGDYYYKVSGYNWGTTPSTYGFTITYALG